MMTH